jgi:REP-associated tyrosine transposase
MDSLHDSHTVHLMVSHILCWPRRRRKILTGPVASRLEQIIHEVANAHDGKVLQLTIQSDHVHLFIRTNPSTLPTAIARLMKGRSSHHIRRADLSYAPQYVKTRQYLF